MAENWLAKAQRNRAMVPTRAEINLINTPIAMSAYLIFTRDKTLDEHELATYSKDAPATLAGHEVKVLAFYGSHEDLEGVSTEDTAILEFPIIEAAKAWYNDSLYREVREHRFKGATYRVILVEGLRSQSAQARHWVEFAGAI
jgi:uncharacterized protein (DUF1330 family)